MFYNKICSIVSCSVIKDIIEEPSRTGSSKENVVFYGQEPPSEEFTTTECGVNYQPLAVITGVAQW